MDKAKKDHPAPAANGGRAQAIAILDWVSRATATVLIPATIWLVSLILDHESRLEVLRETAVGNREASKAKEDIILEIRKLEARIAASREWMVERVVTRQEVLEMIRIHALNE